MQLLRPSSKALALSARISIRTDARGFLSLQYMIRNDDGQVCFVEFFVSLFMHLGLLYLDRDNSVTLWVLFESIYALWCTI